MLRAAHMIAPATSHIAYGLRSTRAASLLVVSLAAAFGYLAWRRRKTEPTAEEVERERRAFLTEVGRITDGSILETQWTDDASVDTPHTLIYQYRIAGVTYECAQDVSPLAEHLRHIRIDLPIQVRFDPRNPADSIVVSERWSGLRQEAGYASPLEPPGQPSTAAETQFTEPR